MAIEKEYIYSAGSVIYKVCSKTKDFVVFCELVKVATIAKMMKISNFIGESKILLNFKY